MLHGSSWEALPTAVVQVDCTELTTVFEKEARQKSSSRTRIALLRTAGLAWRNRFMEAGINMQL